MWKCRGPFWRSFGTPNTPTGPLPPSRAPPSVPSSGPGPLRRPQLGPGTHSLALCGRCHARRGLGTGRRSTGAARAELAFAGSFLETFLQWSEGRCPPARARGGVQVRTHCPAPRGHPCLACADVIFMSVRGGRKTVSTSSRGKDCCHFCLQAVPRWSPWQSLDLDSDLVMPANQPGLSAPGAAGEHRPA